MKAKSVNQAKSRTYFLSERRVRTKLEHQCWGCAQQFPRGSTMLTENFLEVIQGRRVFRTFRYCDQCGPFLIENEEIIFDQFPEVDQQGLPEGALSVIKTALEWKDSVAV
ncbi:hypothetical protein ACQ4M3_09735 [Leptolyngbya sp. AN03gr2]|uniref:hypothetical protein n=1 Tax=Leptolyngbya sp. AN03gr2 TaxID=3423364 RepID=UPI003D315AFB